MRLSRLIASIATLVLYCSATAQPAVQVPTPTLATTAPPYELIGFASEGRSYGPVSQSVRGRFHRVVLVRAGIAYDHPTLRLETLTYGDEACCFRLVSARALPLADLVNYGIELPEATAAEFKFVRWTTPRSIEFTYGPLKCRVGGIGKPNSEVACAR